MTHKGVATCRDGLKAPVLLVEWCKGGWLPQDMQSQEVVGCADSVLGVNSGVLPLLAGVTA